jgi:PAS domain S-box-containing protein
MEVIKAVFECAPDAILIMDCAGRIIRANARAEKMFGYRCEEIVGQPVELLVPERFAAAHRDRCPDRPAEGGAGPTRAVLESFGRRKDGTQFPLEIMVNPQETNDGRFILDVVRDVTERKQAERSLAAKEALLRQFIKHAPAAIAVLDRDLCYLQCSDRWLADFQLAGRDVTGRSHYDLFPDMPDRWKAVHRRVLAGAVERCDEDPFPRADGSTMWVQWECRPWRDAAEEIGGLILFSQTVTDRKLAEEHVRASLREKEVLLKEIHHRVKNNLQIISSLLFLQSTYVTDDTTLEILAESQSRVKAIALIHEKLYRTEQFDRIDFVAYLNDLIAELFRTYRVRDDSVTMHTDIEAIRLGIETALPCGLIVNELVSNALKHAFPAPWTGEVWVDLHRADGNQFALTVRDNGIGLPECVDWQRSQSLGLQLVSDLTKQLGGTLEIEHRAGTSVRLRFTELQYKERG